MKTINKFFLALFVPLAVSCSKDDELNEQPVLPVTMEFTADLSFPELSEGKEVLISFNKPAAVPGTISIEVVPPNATGFNTTPAIVDGEIQLEVAKGATGASFNFEPEDDDLLQGNRTIDFVLLEDSDDFLVGTKDSLNVTIFENEVAASANFSWLSSEIRENDEEELELPIEFSVPVPGEATVKVKVEGENIGDFLATVPPMDANNIIELTVPSGAWEVGIKLQPKNNAILNQHQNLKFKITEVSGPVTKGVRLDLDLNIIDDELLGKLKSVEIIKDDFTVLKTVEYDSKGRISKAVIKEDASGYFRTDNYHYNESGQLTGISATPGDGEYFTWENGKIMMTEKVTGFFGTNQSLFEYKDGKLSRRRDYVMDGNRNTTETDRFIYTYHSSGDLKTEVHSSLVNGVWQEISTTNYDSYGEAINPFPLEAAPGMPLQQHLNGTMTINQNNETRSLYYAHTYDANGKVVTRHDGFELINYYYY